MPEDRRPAPFSVIKRQMQSIEEGEYRTVWYSFEYTDCTYREFSDNGIVVAIYNDDCYLRFQTSDGQIYTIHYSDMVGIA